MSPTTRPAALTCALALTLLAGRPALAEPETAPGPEPLGHKHLEAEHRALSRESFGGLPRNHLPTHLMDTRGGPQVTREVMGYLPYWSYTADAPYVPMRWDLLTILAWFSVEMDGTGAITNRRGWGGQTTARIVQDAHLHGVKVIITITNFTGSEIASIVNNAANRQRAINNCLLLMSEHSADGINVDFEFVPASARNGFVTFMTELKDAVRAAQPNGWEGHVSLAGPAVDWNGAYDYDVLLENTDGIMVMAYGYHWSGSNPGPNSPLETGDLWPGRSIAWTVDDYLTFGEPENRGKVLIGLPWYGRDWQVANTDVPGVRTGSGGSRTFKVAEPEAQALGKTWEDISKSVYYHRTANNQLYQ
ncbi:MAG TPA: glycosyl hydrolase family 18 protein, partial [Myxococcota bacterium]|nr:glycosyl hydrolase family 18 protein [Myxococcota bacterium]